MRDLVLGIALILGLVPCSYAALAIVPGQAPAGGRVIAIGDVGDGLASADVSVATASGLVPATVVSRSATLLEFVVPANAITGAVRVTSGATTIGTATLTIVPPALFVRTATLSGNLGAPTSVGVNLPDGRLVVADAAKHQIRILDAFGAVVAVFGSGKPGFRDGSATGAEFKEPGGIVVDPLSGDIFVADSGNHAIRKIAAGTVVTIAGSGRPGLRDARGADALFQQPAGLALGENGTLYVADTGNHVIRSVTPGGDVTTLAGKGLPGYGDGSALTALFHGPQAIASRGDAVYVADTKNHAVRMVQNGIVTTLAGTTHPGSLDGGAAIAEFQAPAGITVDEDGTIFVADTLNHGIRMIRNGFVTTIAGGNRPGLKDAAGNPLDALFHDPRGMQIEGALFLADARNGALRAVYRGVTVTAAYPSIVNPSGGEPIRLFGGGFVPGATTVIVGGVSVSATYVASTEMLVVTPPLPAGTAEVIVSTPAGSSTLAGGITVRLPFVALRIKPTAATLNIGDELQLSAFGVTAEGAETDLSTAVGWTSSTPEVATVSSTGFVTALASGATMARATYHALVASLEITVRVPDEVPIDETIVAPPVPTTIITPFADVTRFLYDGPDAVQKGVIANAIEEERVAVLRGQVVSRDDTPLGGVRVTVLDHPEYGYTTTRSNGMFDLAVNGGDSLTVRYEKSGYLTVDRELSPVWHDYAYAARAVLIALDTAVTPIEANAATLQVARGNAVTDKNGSRRATLLFPAGTSATMTLADGTQQLLASMLVRATEYSVGPNGPLAMPAELPRQSGYTYCVELSADEALTAGATSVTFSKPVASYVENFLKFPVGGIVPSGYYDRKSGAWVPSRNGVVLKILAVVGSSATLDTNGDGAADSEAVLAALGIEEAERQALAGMYAAGQTLWRVPIEHFTPWDYNWPYGPPTGATAPTQPLNWRPDRMDKPACRKGSIIECENQVLGETVPLAGVGAALHYNSARTRGRKSAFDVTIPLTGASVPSAVRRIELEVTVAGRRFTKSFDRAPSLSYNFTWDGRDVYGRMLNGHQRATVKVGYVYGAVYYRPESLGNAFAAFGTGSTVATTADRTEFVVSASNEISLGAFNATAAGLGGWTLTQHHAYDPERRVLHLGDGSQRNAADSVGSLVETFAKIEGALAAGGDGTVYVSTATGLQKISRAGVITPFASVGWLRGIALDSRGRVYASTQNDQIIRITPTGAVTVVAGTGQSGFSGDGGPATQARLNGPMGIAVAGDTVYFADYFNHRVRSIGRDGVIRTVAGGGFSSSQSGLATSIKLENPRAAAVGLDGKVYFSHGIFRTTNAGVFRLDPSGSMTNVIGGVEIHALVAAPDGGFFLHTFPYRYIWHCKDICRIAIGTLNTPIDYLFKEDGDRPENTPVRPGAMAMGPNGTLYYTDSSDGMGRIRRITPALPGGYPNGSVVASEDGSELYTFDKQGRHLYTNRALTGATKFSFEYDEPGLLAAMSDGDGNKLAVERTADGKPVAITAPGEQRSALTLDANGYLSSIANPARETDSFEYASTGLMVRYRDRRGGLHEFDYDPAGRLERNADPGGYVQTITKQESGSSSMVTLTTGAKSSTYTRAEDSAGIITRTTRDAAGLLTVTIESKDGSAKTVLPDGASVSTTQTADPRFRIQAPISDMEYRTPAGRLFTMRSTRTLQYDPATPDELAAVTTTLQINGRTYTSIFDTAARAITNLSPLGRRMVTHLDHAERPSRFEQTGMVPVTFGYENGALSVVQFGDRRRRYFYDSQRRLARLIDPIGRPVDFAYDDADRVVEKTIPGGRAITYGYDAAGNLTSIAPPSRPAHAFTFTPAGFVASYEAPSVAGVSSLTRFTYDDDHKLKTVTRPDASTVEFAHDAAGRLLSLEAADLSIGFSWDDAGRLQRLTAPGGSLAYAYDGPLRTGVTFSGAVAGTVSHTYDNNLLIRSETVNGSTVEYSRDPDDLLVQAGALTLIRQNDTGFVTGTSLGPVKDTLEYDEYGQISGYTAAYGVADIYAAEYRRDGTGHITGKTETILGTNVERGYQFDVAGRLKRVTSSGTVIAEFEYDANNNRTARRWIGGSAGATHDSQDRLVTYGDANYEYTKNGELKRKVLAGGATTYEYDALGNLRSVKLPGQITIEYLLDAQGRRVGKRVNGTVARAWLYADQLRIVAELDASGNIMSRFVYGARANGPDYMVRSGVIYRIIADHLGSPRLVVNSTDGTIAQRIDYDEFGSVLSDTNPGFQPFGFAGGLYDADTRLVRFGTRDYDPHTGRWTTKEPLGFAGGMNFYAYASNDPISLVDPDGLKVHPASFVGPIKPGDTRSFEADLNSPELEPLVMFPDLVQASQFYYPPGTKPELQYQCVSLTKRFANVPCAYGCWRQGPSAAGSNFPGGTAVAAGWVNGRYPEGDVDKNSGIYVQTNADGSILLIDQWEGHMAVARTVNPRAANGPSNDSREYYVITVPAGATALDLATCSCKR